MKNLEIVRDLAISPIFMVLFIITWLYGFAGLLIARWQLRKLKPSPDAKLIHALKK